MPMSDTATDFASANNGAFVELTLRREDEGELVFVTCDELQGFLLTAKRGWQIRRQLDRLLRIGFEAQGKNAQIYINGSISGETIHAVAKLT